MGKFAFIPAAAGFWGGILFLLLLDHIIPHLHRYSVSAEGPKSRLQRTTMMVLAVTLHNIPEGMAVGVVYAGYLAGNAKITVAAAMALSIGIAIQNFPEGAIISMPLRAEGMKVSKAFAGGVLSGIVEPVGAMLTILAAGYIVPALGMAVGAIQNSRRGRYLAGNAKITVRLFPCYGIVKGSQSELPGGAIISMPLRGCQRLLQAVCFGCGVGAMLTIFAAGYILFRLCLIC